MRFTLSRGLRLVAVTAMLLAPMAASATVEISIGPQDPFERDVTARARWGGSGYEANLRNNGVDVIGSALNPGGAPVWQLGQSYDFRLSWQAATGTTTWQIDFNRDGIFSAAETSSFIKPERIGQSFQYIEMTMATQTNGSNASGLNVNNLTINGTSLGNFAHSGNTARTVWFESTTGFGDIEILGDLSFLRLSGSGNSVFQQERPRLEISFVAPQLLEPVPEPAAWGMLIAGFGLVGARQRRRIPRVAA
jgi:hypothetical protein